MSSFLIGFPTSIVLVKSKYSVLAKEVKTFFAKPYAILFDRPGDISDSCKNTGILNIPAHNVTTKDPDPPLLNTNWGLINKSKKKLCRNPKGILNAISATFLKEKYLLSLPDTMPYVFKFSWDMSKKPILSFGPT